MPITDMNIKISRIFDNEEYVFFRGKTDADGIIESVELPAPPRENSLVYEAPDKQARYRVTADRVGFEDAVYEINIYEGVKTIQPIVLFLKEVLQ